VLAELNPQLAWLVARSAGVVAWALITAGILWGLALSTRLVRRRGVPAWLLDLHRFLGTLSVVFVAVHVAGLWADGYVDFGWREISVPMASSWKPGAVAWGIVATYLLLAIQLTSLAMRRLPRRVWRAVHLASFPLFVVSTIHGFQAGSDRGTVLVEWLALTGASLVTFLVLFRLLAPRRRPQSASASPPGR
jgi:predicted ferric reductase